MKKLNEHVLIALTDHIAFAAENILNGIVIRNKLLREIERCTTKNLVLRNGQLII